MSEPLTSRFCTPCRGGIPPLTPEEVEGHHRQTPAWAICDDSRRIERAFRFKDFAEAFAFLTRVAMHAEKVDHHPDFRVRWNRVDFELSTHSSGGITERDAALAEAIDHLAGP